MPKAKEADAKLAKQISQHFIEFMRTLGVECKVETSGDELTLVEVGEEIKIGNLVIDLPEQVVRYCGKRYDLHDPNCFEKIQVVISDCIVSPCGKECKHYA